MIVATELPVAVVAEAEVEESLQSRGPRGRSQSGYLGR